RLAARLKADRSPQKARTVLLCPRIPYRQQQFGCGSAALWGSHSWLQPAFSRPSAPRVRSMETVKCVTNFHSAHQSLGISWRARFAELSSAWASALFLNRTTFSLSRTQPPSLSADK